MIEQGKIEQSELFKKLQELESEKFGEHTYPISSNIKNKLIPFCEDVLSRIPVYLPEFTLHDINHSYRILENIESFLPESIDLNIVEIQLLIYSVLLHDIGMSPSKDIFNRLESDVIQELEKNIREDGQLKSGLQGYIRKLHPKTSKDIIESIYDYIDAGIDFTYKGIVLKDYIGNIIINHGLDPKKLLCNEQFPDNEIIENEFVNIRFLSVLLRLGDLLDIGLERTPTYLSEYIKIEDEVSKLKWNKSQALRGKIVRPHKVMFNFYSTSIDLEMEIKHYISYVENEIRECNKVLSSSEKKLILSSNIEYKIGTDNSYLSVESKVHLDFKNIINILKGTNLYQDKAVFLRELIQNSYDAIECKKAVDDSHVGNIEIEYNTTTEELLFKDNGMGIDKHIFENFVINIGESYYRSSQFLDNFSSFKPIGKFGIGIISNFMVSDTIEVISIKESLLGMMSKPISYKIFVDQEIVVGYPITVKEFKKKYSGFNTIVKLKLKQDFLKDFDMKKLLSHIENIISYKKFNITVLFDGNKEVLNQNLFIDEQVKFEKKFNHPSYYKIPYNNETDNGTIYLNLSHEALPTLLSQSSILINNVGNVNILKLRWINNLSIYIDLNYNMLDLKASRNEINYDERFYNFRKSIVDNITSTLKTSVLHFGRNPEWHIDVLDEHEFDFLLNQDIYMGHPNEDSSKFLTYTLKKVLSSKKVVWTHILNREEILLACDSETCILNDDIHYNYKKTLIYFLELNEVTYTANYVIDDSLIYFQITIDADKNNVKFKKYDEELNLNIETDFSFIDAGGRDIFFFANDYINNFISVTFNLDNKLGKLMIDNKVHTEVQAFQRSIENVIQNAFITGKRIEEFRIDRGHRFAQYRLSKTVSKSITGLFTESFVTAMNEYLEETFLPELEVPEKEYSSYIIKKDNFPKWYFNDA